MKKNTFFLFIIFLPFLGCKKDKIWIASYIGKDMKTRKNSSGTSTTEYIPVEVNITEGSESGHKDIEVTIKFFYTKEIPFISIIPAEASKTSFKLLDKAFPPLKDTDGTFTLYYSNGKGEFLNESKDLKITIDEKKSYDVDKSRSYDAVHIIELNKK